MSERCPQCGYCPTCGRSNQFWYEPRWEVISPYPIYQSAGTPWISTPNITVSGQRATATTGGLQR